MSITHTTQSISAERYLLETIKKFRYDPRLLCFKSNNFDDIPEYYLVKHCIKYASRPRTDTKKLENNSKEQEVILVDSSKICDALLKLMKENDNSHTKLDDSFYLKTVYESLGKSATYSQLGQCIDEFEKCLKIEKINPSFSHARVIGAIKGFGYLNLNRTHVFVHGLQHEFSMRVKDINQLYKTFENGIQNKSVIQIIYNMEIKKLFISSENFNKAMLQAILKIHYLLTSQNSYKNAQIYLDQLFERVLKLHKKSIKKAINPLEIDIVTSEKIWDLIRLPISTISVEFLYTLKQIWWLLFKDQKPKIYDDKIKDFCNADENKTYDPEFAKVNQPDVEFGIKMQKDAKKEQGIFYMGRFKNRRRKKTRKKYGN